MREPRCDQVCGPVTQLLDNEQIGVDDLEHVGQVDRIRPVDEEIHCHQADLALHPAVHGNPSICWPFLGPLTHISKVETSCLGR